VTLRFAILSALVVAFAVFSVAGRGYAEDYRYDKPTYRCGQDSGSTPTEGKCVGTEGKDFIMGNLGDNDITGLGGADDIDTQGCPSCDYGAHDSALGGLGNDWMWGGANYDFLHGQEGEDRLWGYGGNDVLHGGDGDDRMYGGRGNDDVYSSESLGNDTIDLGSGDDKGEGGVGNDTLLGGEGHDILYGDEPGEGCFRYLKSDTLRGGKGPDSLHGGDGRDRLYYS
jgi:Ca2+-binding RTX toxin-like protein